MGVPSSVNGYDALLAAAAGALGVPVGSVDGRSVADLGASSLEAARLAVILRRAHGVETSAADLLLADDLATYLASLADAAGSAVKPAGGPVGDIDRPGPQVPLSPPGKHYSGGERVPLTWQQRVVWYQTLLDPGSPRYQFHALFQFDAAPELPALRAALSDLLRRQPVLRLQLDLIDGEPFQVVPLPNVSDRDLDLDVVRLGTAPASHEALVAAAGGHIPFDLYRGPLVRWRLVVLPDGSASLVHTEHHLVHDGMSFLAVVQTLGTAGGEPDHRYFTYAAEQSPPDPDLVRRVAEACGRADLSTFASSFASRDRLAVGAASAATSSAPPSADDADLFLRLPIPTELLADVREVARRHHMSLFTVLFAAFSTAVARHQHKRGTFVIGSAVDDRPPGHEETVGMFVSTVPVLVDVDEESAGDVPAQQLPRIREALVESLRRSDVPVQEVVAALGAASRGDRTLIPTAFSLHQQAEREVEFAGRRARVEVGIFNGAAKFAVNVIVLVTGAGTDGPVELLFEGDSEVVERTDLWSLWTYLVRWLRRLTGAPERSMPTAVGGSASRVVERVRRHAMEAPARPAFRDERHKVSYQDLVDLGTAASTSIGPGQVVGILGAASARFFAAAYAVVQAGSAYVPLESNQPIGRLAHMVRQSGCALLIDVTEGEAHVTADGLAERVPEVSQLRWRDWTTPVGARAPAANPPVRPESVAYIMFTSGSTGSPKGVAVPRRAIDLLGEWGATETGMTPGVVVGQGANTSFDASAWEIWSALWAGAETRVAPVPYRADPISLANWLATERVTVIFLSTAIAELLAQLEWPPGSALRVLATGGDRLHQIPVGLPFRVLNLYGPTETTVVGTASWVDPTTPGLPPIGHPLPYVSIRIVTDDATEVPTGAPGELWIGGGGLAVGYVGDEAQTFGRFVPDPHSATGETVYRTGDVVAMRSDGSLDFFGRRDRQVKISGARVELGEVEATAMRVRGVLQAYADMGRDPALGRPRLFVVPDSGAGENLPALIRRELPSYLHHLTVRVVDALPLNASGKLDGRLLDDDDRTAPIPAAELLSAPGTKPRGATDEFAGAAVAAGQVIDAVAILWPALSSLNRTDKLAVAHRLVRSAQQDL